MHKVEAYQCDYCTKYGKSRSNIGQHEKSCFHNPENKACATCSNFIQSPYKTITDNGNECTAYLPTCFIKIPIAVLDGEKKVLNLKDHCKHWQPKETDIDDEY